MDEEAAILWQDVLDEILAGRDGNLSCPHCSHTPLKVTREDGKTRIACDKCERYIEGRFGV